VQRLSSLLMRREHRWQNRFIVGLTGLALTARFVLQRKQLSNPKHPLATSLDSLVTTSQMSLDDLITSGKSLIRWGDGDTMSAIGLTNSFEPRNLKLASELREIVRRAPGEKDFILGLPMTFLAEDDRIRIPPERLRQWGLTLLLLSQSLREPVAVFDSFAFRGLKGAPRRSKIITLPSVLESVASKPLIVVGPAGMIEAVRKVGGHSLAGQVRVPESRAYADVDEISEKVQELLDVFPEAICLVSAGSAGRVVISRLCGRGQFIDIGQIAG